MDGWMTRIVNANGQNALESERASIRGPILLKSRDTLPGDSDFSNAKAGEIRASSHAYRESARTTVTDQTARSPNARH
jgi:hypothetical protein